MTGLGNIDDVYRHYLVVIEENQQLKELLKKCIKHFDELLLGLEKADVKHFVGIPYYPSIEFVHYLKHIDNAIGEKK